MRYLPLTTFGNAVVPFREILRTEPSTPEVSFPRQLRIASAGFRLPVIGTASSQRGDASRDVDDPEAHPVAPSSTV
tara:strand:+ start:1078 stop:1305 length:228 start_codon:yes stop_codon:yes gene_type:complete